MTTRCPPASRQLPERSTTFLERARSLDREILHLARDDGTARLVLGRLANRFIRMRGCERFGLTRLGNYATARIDLSGRQLEQLALVARRLADLPLIEAALRNGSLSWSKARLLDGVATPSDESQWLAVAEATNVRALAGAAANARAALREQRQLTGTFAFRTRKASSCHESDGDDAEEHVRVRLPCTNGDDAEEHVRVRLPCTKRAARTWLQIRRHAARLAGHPLPVWQVAELVAAHASSSAAPYERLWRQEPWRTLAFRALDDDPQPDHRDQRPTHRCRTAELPQPASSRGEACEEASLQRSPFEHELEGLEELDVPELDAAMRRVRHAMQQRQSLLGISLGRFLDLRLHEDLGYTGSAEYVRERLGMSERTARELVRVAKAAQNGSPLLASAYAGGKVSWLQVLTLLPVVRSSNAAAWIERSGEVTLHRLADEVDWVLRRLDQESTNGAAMPPPAATPLVDGDERQMCASHSNGAEHSTCADSSNDELWGVTGRVHVSFLAPRSVAILSRSVLQGFAAPTEPRWKAFERMIDHVLAQWRNVPEHRARVF